MSSLLRKHYNQKLEAASNDLYANYWTARNKGMSDEKIVTLVSKKHGITKNDAYTTIAAVCTRIENEQRSAYRSINFVGSKS